MCVRPCGSESDALRLYQEHVKIRRIADRNTFFPHLMENLEKTVGVICCQMTVGD